MPHRLSIVALLASAFLLDPALAHHSYAPYDDTKTVELEGTLVEVSWRNPHVHLTVEVVEADQRRVRWVIETVGVNQQRLRVPLEGYEAGQRVKVAGWPNR
jgi:hypothetical protein